MSTFHPNQLAYDPDRLNARKDAQTTLKAYAAFLADPAFAHRVDLKVLTSIAGDSKMPVRERRRAAEILGKLYLAALDRAADLTCVREQVLQSLGIDPRPSGATVAVDARSITIEADRDALRTLLADPEAARLAAALAARVDGRPRVDGAPADGGALRDPEAPAHPLDGDFGDDPDRGAAPRADATAAREVGDGQRLDPDLAAQRLPDEAGDARVVLG
jgi:hypothetical protein